MAFKIIYGDICEMKVDAIVNSLGTKMNVAGAVCRDVLMKSKSEELYSLVNTDKDGKVFDRYVTAAGHLPAKHIISIVSPYKHEDDEKLSKLKLAYELCIKEAIKRKYKSLALPFLGTGANGYNRLDVYTAATEVGRKYIDEDSNNIDIILTIYNKKVEDFEKARERELELLKKRGVIATNYPHRDHMEDNNEDLSEFELSMRINSIFNMMKHNEMCIPKGNVHNAFHLIEEYMDQHDIPKNYFYAEAIDKDYCSKFRTSKRKMSRENIYRSAVALGLNRTVFLQLMTIGGFSFSPFDATDMWFYNYYLKNEIEPDQGHFLDKYYDEIVGFKNMFK